MFVSLCSIRSFQSDRLSPCKFARCCWNDIHRCTRLLRRGFYSDSNCCIHWIFYSRAVVICVESFSLIRDVKSWSLVGMPLSFALWDYLIETASISLVVWSEQFNDEWLHISSPTIKACAAFLDRATSHLFATANCIRWNTRWIHYGCKAYMSFRLLIDRHLNIVGLLSMQDIHKASLDAWNNQCTKPSSWYFSPF